MNAPLLLEALLTELKNRKLPHKIQDQVKELYEITYREAFKEGQRELLEPDPDDEL
jgi:hypothetical protein